MHNHHNHHNHSEEKHTEAMCPVMNAPVNKKEAEEKGLVREYKGAKYYFCCAGCPEQFDENPEKYIKNNTNEQNHKRGCC